MWPAWGTRMCSQPTTFAILIVSAGVRAKSSAPHIRSVCVPFMAANRATNPVDQKRGVSHASFSQEDYARKSMGGANPPKQALSPQWQELELIVRIAPYPVGSATRCQ
jgi:hypothetical protein